MVRRAILPSVVAFAIAAIVAAVLGGPGAALSAAIGVIVVFANFAVHGWSLGRASAISITAVHAVALVGPVVRIGIIVGLMFLLDTFAWFSPVAFGLTVVPATIALLVYEARLTMRGVGGQLQIPANPPAARASAALAAKENA
jgi:ATP synthase protein I